jgi:hypothetical protein
MKPSWLSVVLGGLLAGAIPVGCNVIAGIEEGVLAPAGDASVDGTTDAAPPESGRADGPSAEAGHEAGPDAGTADAASPVDARPPDDAHPPDDANPAGIGSPCTSPKSCPTGICLPSGVCSVPCGDGDGGVCPPTWTCSPVGGGGNACTCSKTHGGVETCDGKDNDCNGVVDDGANAACAASGRGALSACVALGDGGAACACPTTDNQCESDLCADLQNDAKNCGRCGRDCQYPQGGGCAAGQCGAFAFVDSTAFDAGGLQRIGGIAVDSSYVYFSYSASSSADATSILRCPANMPGACTSPETFVDGIAGGAGSVSVDPGSGSLAGTTGVPGGKAGVAYLIARPTGGSAPAAVTVGAALQTENLFAGGVTNGAAVAWLDLEQLGIDVGILGRPTDGGYEYPTASVAPGSPTVLLAVPAHSSIYCGLRTANGGQIGVCALPGCGAPGAGVTPILNGNNYIGTPNAMAFDGNAFYVAASGVNGAAGAIWTFAWNQSTTTSMATAQDPRQLTLDSRGRVYWIDKADESKIWWCPTTGCPKPPVLPNAISIASAPANAGTSVLVTDEVSLYWNAATPAGGTTVARVALP